jgi:hypothetical protein
MICTLPEIGADAMLSCECPQAVGGMAVFEDMAVVGELSVVVAYVAIWPSFCSAPP